MASLLQSVPMIWRRAGMIVLIALAGCSVACTRASYPAATVASSVQDLMRREYGMDSTARIVGNTLYLELRMGELTTTDAKKLGAVMRQVQGAVLTITRVSLSSDAPIRFMVVSASDPAWRVGLRIVQYLQDVKDYFYQRISRGDYEERLVFEMETGEEVQLLYSTPDRVPLRVTVSTDGCSVAPLDQGLTMEEFVGRLIVSQFNMMNRNNPFLGVILHTSKLRYHDLRDGILWVRVANLYQPRFLPLTQNLLVAEARKAEKKYPSCPVKTIRLFDDQGATLDIPTA